jgi:MFS family permease
MTFARDNSAYDVLKIPDYRNFIIARTLASFGITMMATIVGWQIYNYTHDVLSLGLIGLAEFIPAFIVSLVGGYVADNFNRKKIILTCFFLLGISAVTLLLLSTKFEFLIRTHGVVFIYGVVGFTGLVRGFLSPASSAFGAQLIPKELFAKASTWSTMSWHIANIGGPAVGGLIYALTQQAGPCYFFVIVFVFTGLFFANVIPSRHISRNKDSGEKREGFRAAVYSGLRFVFKNQIILGAISLDMLAVLFGGAVAMLPAFAKDILNLGPEGLGLMRAAPAIGALIMAWILTHYPIKQNAGKVLLFAVAGFGICTIFFAVSTHLWLSLLMLAGTGFFDNISMVVRGTTIQLYTPNEMRGRVSAVNSLFIGSSNELGGFESGVAARFMGLVPSVVFGGVMTLIVVTSTWFAAPKLRDLNEMS